MTEKTEQVLLTLEESGWLCHMLLAEIHKPWIAGESVFSSSEIDQDIRQRQEILWRKLVDANDSLMNKK